MILVALFCSSCQNSHQSTSKKIGTIITQQTEDGTIELSELLVQQKLNWIVTPLILGLFIGIVLTFFGVRAIGLGVITASITCLVLILTLSLYLKWVALGGIVVLLIGFYFLGKALYDNIIVKRELYSATESAKLLLSAEKRKELSNSLKKVQTKATKNIVSKLKSG